MMNRSLPPFRGSEMSRTGALVWFYLISSLQRLPSKDSCHTSRRSMLLRSSIASVRWPTGWQGRQDHMSRREATSRKRLTLLTAQILLIQMMIRWWDRLNGFRTTKSRSNVLLVTKNPKNMGLILPKLTRSSTCCCQRDRLSLSRITRSWQIKSWRISSTTSGTMQHLMIQMSAKYFISRYNRLLSKGDSSLKFPRSRWKLISICSLPTW